MTIFNLLSTVFFFIILGINLLSYFSLVTRFSVFVLLMISIALAYFINRNKKERLLPRFSIFWNNPLYLLFLILLSLLIFQAILYPPNTWDSMTYHMSRIVYWIQNQSIEYFPTNNSRQNILNPGAEILIMVAQILLNTDRFANLLQTYGWVMVFVSNLSIARTLNPNLSPIIYSFIGALSMSLPMGLLQATSTQNDLITSGFVCLSIYNIICAVRNPRNRLAWFHLRVSIGLVHLIKPTGILAVFPFIVYFSVIHWKEYFKIRLAWLHIGYAILIALIVVGPDTFRKIKETGSLIGVRHEVYNFSHPLTARVLNSIRGVFYHIPIEKACNHKFHAWIQENTISPYERANPCIHGKIIIHEDHVGNFIHFLVFLLLPILFLISIFKMKIQESLFYLLPLFSWILLHFFVQDQTWISRLQTPAFLVMPLAFVFVSVKKRVKMILKIFIILSFIISIYIIFNNHSRKLENIKYVFKNRVEMYYKSQPHLYSMHNQILMEARQSSCRMFGIHIEGDSWDYPLAWQGFKSGIRFEQVPKGGDFGKYCGIYTEFIDFQNEKFQKIGSLYLKK